MSRRNKASQDAVQQNTQNGGQPGVPQTPSSSGAGSDAQQQAQAVGQGSEVQAGSNSQIADRALANMLNVSGGLSFSYPLGLPIPLSNKINDSFYEDEMYRSVLPGIITVEIAPCYGDFHERTDSINLAADAEFTTMRKAQSGRKNYDQASLMLSQIAIAEIFAAIGWLTRVYGISTLYSADNRYLPTGLLEALGFDADDVLKHKPELLFQINNLVYQVSTFVVPSSIPLFKRRATQFSSVYREYDGPRAQMYMYKPASFLRYTSKLSDSNPYGALEYARVPYGVNMKVDQAVEFVSDMINALMWNEDVVTINGDLAKAFGADVINISPISADYVVIPVVDVNELETIKNLNDLSNVGVIELGPIKHVMANGLTPTSCLEASAKVITENNIGDGDTDADKFKVAYLNRNMMLSSDAAVLDTLGVVSRCRLMSFAEVHGKEHTIKCGAELVTGVHVWTYDYKTHYTSSARPHVRSMKLFSGGVHLLNDDLDNTRVIMDNIMEVAEAFANFKYAPSVFTAVDVNDGIVTTNFIYDFNNFTVVTPTDLERMFIALRAYIFNVPRIG
nr:capsid protein [Marmot picobirnavirus]